MQNSRYLIYLLLVSILMPVKEITAQARLSKDKQKILVIAGDKQYEFSPSFVVLHNAKDPKMALKPVNIPNVAYNVLTWLVTDSAKADFKKKEVNASVAGDGFDDKVLRTKTEPRTANIYHAGKETILTANEISQKGDTVYFDFPVSADFMLKAYVVLNARPYPLLTFSFTPYKDGFYSVGYNGAPAINQAQAAEIWQPLIWQEKRIPAGAFLTPSFMAPLPTTLVNDGSTTIGVLAAPEHLPFQPLPLLINSQFGVGLVNRNKELQPQLYAPIPGGYLSQMKAKEIFQFSLYLLTEQQPVTEAYETIAKKVFGFKDYRKNDIASLNTVLDNIVDYSKSKYALFVDSLKGCAYSTDVPGAVKNVSSLNPLELAIVRDDSVMFEKRAYPLMEFMLSREKFLFSLDSNQKIQSPSRKLKGPVAPVAELVALYKAFNKENAFLLSLAEKELDNSRVRNLDVPEKGDNWINMMHLYKATGKKTWLDAATKLADSYLAQRVAHTETDFTDPFAGAFFFWTSFTNRWTELFTLFELTGNQKYLDAAREGARYYAMFAWMAPAIPDSSVTVNKDGKAPMYWYLKAKGHQQMYYPEEKVPAWRLSEIGLTPESSGTSNGHRAIFMANYAPWMLRIGYYAKDSFLMNIARSAIIGRYTSFPGYHINTERTTAYEKADFPLHTHLQQSVNSFHYNHILPMASMVLDYLVTDVFVKSKGQISFPSEYIEGYAYLQNKMYGVGKGQFYNERDVQLWMPEKLLMNVPLELNYVSGRKNNSLLVAFTNQSDAVVSGFAQLNNQWIQSARTSQLSLWKKGQWMPYNGLQKDGIKVEVAPKGIAVVRIDGLSFKKGISEALLANHPVSSNGYKKMEAGNAHAMFFQMGNYDNRLYLYLEDDDTKVQKAVLQYEDANGQLKSVEDTHYPFEFTISAGKQTSVRYTLTVYHTNGKTEKTATILIGNK